VFVGVLKLSFHLPGARSLKDKRQVVRSFRDKVRARLDVSIAEVDHLDLHQRATFGVAVVSNDATICDELLASVGKMANNVRDAVLVDRATEIMTINNLESVLEPGPAKSMDWDDVASARRTPPQVRQHDDEDDDG
jgi:uncharacterized protein